MSQILFNNAYNLQKNGRRLESVVNNAIDSGDINSCLIIVPTGKQVHSVQSDFIRKYFIKYAKPVGEFGVFTFQSFVMQCFNKIIETGKYRIISDAYRLAIFGEAAESAELRFFKKAGGRISPVVVQRLSNIIYGLKEDGIRPWHLQKDIENAEANKDEPIDVKKLGDIALLFEKYQSLLGDTFLDFPDLLELVNSNIRRSQKSFDFPNELFPAHQLEENKKYPDSIFPLKPVIFLNGFSEFKGPEVEFLSLFGKSDLPLAIDIDYSVDNGPLFGNLENLISRLKDSGFNLAVSEIETIKNDSGSQIELTPSQFLRQHLFVRDSDAKSENFSEIIKIIAADDRNDEVKSLARLVKWLIIKQEYAPGEICISARRPDLYSGIIREVFSQYDIPVNITDRYPLSNSPVIVALFSILDILSRGYRRDDIHKALSSGYLTFGNGEGYVIDSVNLLDIAAKYRIAGGTRRGGAENWEKRLALIENALFSRLHEFNDSDSEGDVYELENLEKTYSSVKKALDDFLFLKTLLPELKPDYDPSEFHELIINQIIDKFEIQNNILEIYNSLIPGRGTLHKNELIERTERIEKEGRALSAFIGLLDEMCFIINERRPGQRFNLEDLVGNLRMAVSGEKYQVHEKRNFGVTVTSVEQTRGIPYKVMILCGAVDGEFPLTYIPEVFLGKDLPEAEREHIHSERMQFYQFLTNNPNDLDRGNIKIYITYPKTEREAELVKSQFIDSLLKITTLESDNCIFDLFELRKKYSKENYFDENTEWLFAISSASEALKYAGGLFAEKNVENISHTEIENLKETYLSDYRDLIYIEKLFRDKIEKNTDNEILKLDPEQKEKYIEFYKKHKTYSASELETYQKCPYKYFVRYNLNIKEPVENELKLTPLELGNLLHLVLYRFFTKIGDREGANQTNNDMDLSGKPLPIRLEQNKKEQYREMIFEIAREELDGISFDHPYFELAKEEIFGTPTKPGLLDIWLDREMERINAGWNFIPVLFEFGFGLKTINAADSKTAGIEINENLRLKGKIDRVEIHEDDSGIYFLIADYKSTINGASNENEIVKGISFQMPLYLEAAKNILTGLYGSVVHPAGGVYYILKPAADSKTGKITYEKLVLVPGENSLAQNFDKKARPQIKSYDDLDSALDNSISIATETAEKIANGIFRVEPLNRGVCSYCKFIQICRIRERFGEAD